VNPFTRPWRHLFDFRGRASRREYALFHLGIIFFYFLITTLTGIGMALAFAFFGEPDGAASGTILGVTWIGELALFVLIFLIGHLSVSIRRLHDQNKPWLGYLLTLIPLLGIAFWALLVFTRGSEGENDYGYDPRQPEPVSTEMLGSVFS
jgi:uncharacterized membrane protein YhaH (DUF805 family)